MLRPRIIPCLLIHKGGLVKTLNFTGHKYLGDPLNAVRIFNEKQVDELLVVDIDASRMNRPPDYAFINKLAQECRMPLCYGGGVKSVDDFDRLIRLGVEKVAISSAAVDSPQLVLEAANRVGSQSVVVVIDYMRKNFINSPEVVTLNSTKRTGLDPIRFAIEMENRGAGEIVFNSVDRDGQMQGYDMELIEVANKAISVPLTVLGGAGSLEDIGGLVGRFGVIGAAAGSIFVFKGKYKAVLISYPSPKERNAIFMRGASR